jgi:hypothetical protein
MLGMSILEDPSKVGVPKYEEYKPKYLGIFSSDDGAASKPEKCVFGNGLCQIMCAETCPSKWRCPDRERERERKKERERRENTGDTSSGGHTNTQTEKSQHRLPKCAKLSSQAG